MQSCQPLSDITTACSRIVSRIHIANTHWEDTICANISRTPTHRSLRMCQLDQEALKVSTTKTSHRKPSSNHPTINMAEHHHMDSHNHSSTADTAKHHLLHKTSIQALRIGRRTALHINHKEQAHTLSNLQRRSPTMHLPRLNKTSTRLTHP